MCDDFDEKRIRFEEQDAKDDAQTHPLFVSTYLYIYIFVLSNHVCNNSFKIYNKFVTIIIEPHF